jgi:hypothetical protein
VIDIEKTIISQYANSPTLIGLIKGMNEYIDPRSDIDQFYDYVWNVDTAVGFGLDIWGRIVGVGRYLTIPGEIPTFGFYEAEMSPFDSDSFYDGAATSSTYRLEDEAYRRLILFKALSNIIQPNAFSINQLLQNMFEGRGRCYVNDLGNMTMQLTFEFDLEPFEDAIVRLSNAIPRPAGVKLLINDDAESYFGFYEGVDDPFDSFPFFNG